MFCLIMETIHFKIQEIMEFRKMICLKNENHQTYFDLHSLFDLLIDSLLNKFMFCWWNKDENKKSNTN
jgi:hypothetical protein